MAERNNKSGERKETLERVLLLYRNFNIVGTIALGGLAVLVPVTALVALPLAGLNAVQAGVAETVRRSRNTSAAKK